MSVLEDLELSIALANERSIQQAVQVVQAKDPGTIIPTMQNPYSAITATNDPFQAVSGFPQWGSLGTSGSKWSSFVVHPNGKLYGIPRNASQVLEFDPIAKTTTLFGSLGTGTNKWMGGVLGSDGLIYGIPFSSTAVLVIDPSDRTASTWGVLSGSSKWVGGVALPDGRILGIPYNSNNYLLMTPGASSPTTRSGAGGGNGKFFGGVIYGEEVFMAPHTQTSIRAYNFNSYSARNLSVSNAPSNGWAGGCVTSQNTIVFAPYNANTILELNPLTNQITQYAIPAPTSNAKYAGFSMAPNGNAYAIPYSAPDVLEFNPITKQIARLPVKTGTLKWQGGCLARDGSIYGCPHTDSRVLEIPLGGMGPNWWALSAYVNKL